jgi:hypothetical protein
MLDPEDGRHVLALVHSAGQLHGPCIRAKVAICGNAAFGLQQLHCMAHFATPLVFSNERRPPNPKRPIKTGIITDGIQLVVPLISNAALDQGANQEVNSHSNYAYPSSSGTPTRLKPITLCFFFVYSFNLSNCQVLSIVVPTWLQFHGPRLRPGLLSGIILSRRPVTGPTSDANKLIIYSPCFLTTQSLP